jgi:hypothetical protein
MFNWFKKENKSNKEIAIDKFRKVGLTFEEADYLAQDIAELSLFTDNNLFDEEDNVNNLSEAYNDRYYMSTVDSIIDNNSPLKDIAYTGILARDRGLNFEIRTAIKNSIFEYLERANLDNSNFKEAFIQTIETVKLNSKEDIQSKYEDIEIEEENLESYFSKLNKNIMQTTDEQLNTMKELGFTHYGIITRVGLEQINPFDSGLPKSFIRFDEDYQKIYVKYENQETTFRYSFTSIENNMVTYGEGSVRYTDFSGEPFLYMDAGDNVEIAVSLARM